MGGKVSNRYAEVVTKTTVCIFKVAFSTSRVPPFAANLNAAYFSAAAACHREVSGIRPTVERSDSEATHMAPN